MLQRPLSPFRVKPVRTVTVRRTVSAETIREIADREPAGIKAARATLRVGAPRKASLKVLAKNDNV